MKTAILLGAGASAAEGLPIQANLFRDYFKLLRVRNNSTYWAEHENELAVFFELMFGIKINDGNLDNEVFPTFEEALGVLDLADSKNEAFRHFNNINIGAGTGQIKSLRIYLVYLMADILNESLIESKNLHKKLIKKLDSLNLINETVFVTTNYDILCDNALLDYHPKKIDYGIDFVNYKQDSFRTDLDSIKFFKLHGSLNWVYCPVCNKLRYTFNENGAYNLMFDYQSSYCETCESAYSPFIVPPTFYKDLSKVFLNQVWNKTEIELLDVEHLIFCGYSFPDADLHLKYLIKRVQKNRKRSHKLKITVINNHQGKKAIVKTEEKNRYHRFLGTEVNYTDFSFEDFAKNPMIVI